MWARSSARAGIFDERGTLLATARHPIALWHEAGDIVEQSSADIWSACAAAVRAAHAEAGSAAGSRRRRGLRCDLLAGGARPGGQPAQRQPVRRATTATSSSGWIIAPWPKRAPINDDRRTPCSRYVGGSISPEMEIPEAALAEAALCRRPTTAPAISLISPTSSPSAPPARRRARCARSPASGTSSRMRTLELALSRARRPGRPGAGRLRADRPQDRGAREPRSGAGLSKAAAAGARAARGHAGRRRR